MRWCVFFRDACHHFYMTKRLEVREIEGENIVFFKGERVPEEFIRSVRVEQLEITEIDGEEVMFVDGVRKPQKDAEWIRNTFSDNKKIFIVFREGVIEYLREIKFGDFKNIRLLSFNYNRGFEDFRISRIFINNLSEIEITIYIMMIFEEWEDLKKIKKKSDALCEKLLEKFKGDLFLEGDSFNDRFPHVKITGKKLPDQCLYQEMSYIIEKLSSIQQEILSEGLLDEQPSIMQEFEFPKEIRVYCEQYLIYFAQFLKDVGVEVTASITENDGKSIFHVTPKSKDEALKKIHKALGAYLNLPVVVTLDQFPSLDSSMEVKILHSQIHDFQNKLSLAIEKIRQQNLSLEMKNRIIDQQNSLMQSMQSGRVLMESMRDEDQDCEKIIDGALSIKKYDLGPLELDLPNIFRKMKEMFRDSRDD